jgi:hypothetical protein
MNVVKNPAQVAVDLKGRGVKWTGRVGLTSGPPG